MDPPVSSIPWSVILEASESHIFVNSLLYCMLNCFLCSYLRPVRNIGAGLLMKCVWPVFSLRQILESEYKKLYLHVYVVVQFYPWFSLTFHLCYTPYHTLPYTCLCTKEKKIDPRIKLITTYITNSMPSYDLHVQWLHIESP